MKIAVVTNYDRQNGFGDIKEIAKLFSGSAEILYEESRKKIEGVTLVSEDSLYKTCDVILSLGGDGTLLSVAEKASLYGKPVLGINTGRLGFLTGVERDYFFSVGYKKLLSGFETEKRMMIRADVFSENERTSYHALNDIVIARTSFARVGNISVFVDDELLANYLADGVIVATPTGSTAYSLSAGGPIVDPAIEAMVITPICPHMLNARPLVVPPGKTVTVLKTEGYKNECAVTVDGRSGCMLNEGSTVKICRSERYTYLVKITNKSFYRLLKEKLQY